MSSCKCLGVPRGQSPGMAADKYARMGQSFPRWVEGVVESMRTADAEEFTDLTETVEKLKVWCLLSVTHLILWEMEQA